VSQGHEACEAGFAGTRKGREFLPSHEQKGRRSELRRWTGSSSPGQIGSGKGRRTGVADQAGHLFDQIDCPVAGPSPRWGHPVTVPVPVPASSRSERGGFRGCGDRDRQIHFGASTQHRYRATECRGVAEQFQAAAAARSLMQPGRPTWGSDLTGERTLDPLRQVTCRGRPFLKAQVASVRNRACGDAVAPLGRRRGSSPEVWWWPAVRSCCAPRSPGPVDRCAGIGSTRASLHERCSNIEAW